ncbi:flagellar hook-length control protein FliK [Halopseudomonas pertucinogena]|uniref:Flagellar hook-length control protein FliK n=1 Tax=Halopseudomonas pertucinogena TaxID=86175 RepID=A0ABQ2CKQ6_9GAMM|nr:flagellar hook-length control protein FliK [Halopseudomonas pertucinogena]GGI93838.1 flagellar hook-length control protein FliK [Halopseudomonas pertucinogena]
MTPDLNLPPISPSPPRNGPSSAAAGPSAVPLELLRPIAAATLAPGENAEARVVSSEARGGQFEVLLRLARAAGGTADISVASRQPLEPGSAVTVQALTPTRLLALINDARLSSQAPPVLTRLDPQLFPAGSVLQARVVESQPLADAQARFAILAKVLQGAAAGSVLSMESSRPAVPGSLLTATVDNRGALRVNSAQQQLHQLELMQGMRASLQNQLPAPAMLQVLDRLAGLPDLPSLLRTCMQQVLNHVATPEHLGSTGGVAQAIRQSGLFLEANLQQLQRALGGASPGSADGNGTNTNPAQGQLPPLSRVLPLLASLATPPGTEPLPGADFKASLITLLITLQQHLPPDASKALTLPPGPWQQALVVRPGMFPLPSRAVQAFNEAPDLGSLLRLTAALLSRIQHHQFQSLGQTQTFADGSSQTVWQLDLPLRDGQQFTQVQLRIQQDKPAPDRRQGEQAPQWEIRLAFNLDHLGPLQAIARLQRGRVSSEFWAEKPDTLQLLHRELGQLRDRLLTRGLEVGELSCHHGTPPEPQQAVQQRWIDEVT